MNRDEKEDYLKSLLVIIKESNDNYEKELAMETILKDFEPFRKSLAKKFAGKGVEFDDIVQQIDLKLIEGMYDYDESLDSSAIRHITSKARNGVFNFYKKEMNYFKEDRKFISLDNTVIAISHNGHNAYIENILFARHGVDFDEDAIIDMIMLEEGLDSLTEHQKKLINMYYLSDMTQEEISSELQIHQTNVSRATKRGIKRLQDNLNPSDEHDDTL